MKRLNFSISCAMFVAAVSVCCHGADGPVARVVAPLPYYSTVAKRVASMIQKRHVLRQPFNDEVSCRAWTNLVTMYDFGHAVFLQEDLDRFAPMQTRIDDALRAGDVSFGYDVHRLFVTRLGECVTFATNLIEKNEFDFSSNEVYEIRRDKMPWPVSREEREDIWRRRIKNELLAQILSKELDDEDEKNGKKKKDSVKAKKDDGNSEKPSGTNDVEKVEPPKTPQENLLERYRHYLTMVLTEIDEETVMQRYMSAVTQAYDPHSDYMAPMRKEDFDMDMNLSLCGVGAVLSLSLDDGALEIKEVMKGGPMAREGSIKAGSKIVGVGQGDGPVENVTWKPMRKTIRKIRGKKDTKVVLEITDKNGESRRRVPLIRDEIKLEDQAATGRVETVTLNGVTNRMGYVKLPSFYGTMDKRPGDEGYRSCSWDVAKLLSGFNAEGVSGLVLDLRGNGGGSLPEAVLLTQLFVSPSPVVQIADLRGIGVLRTFEDQPSAAFRKPVVVLVDRHSASASEIVAGALKDLGRAIVAGDLQTHGKGTVQTVLPMGGEKFGSMKITTARFFRINGSSTQVKGVDSDLHLPSVFDARDDIGEDKLPNALPWKAIQQVPHDDVWNMKSFVSGLRELSAQRVASSPEWDKRRRQVAFFRDYSLRVSVPLERNARLALMKEDRKVFDEADSEDGEFDDEDVDGEEKESSESDLVLREALNVLADIVRETGGSEMPPPAPRDNRLPLWLRALGGEL